MQTGFFSFFKIRVSVVLKYLIIRTFKQSIDNPLLLITQHHEIAETPVLMVNTGPLAQNQQVCSDQLIFQFLFKTTKLNSRI
jgi:hypothetical protein